MPFSFRTRFAPSPTGYLHLGSARTALFAVFFARSNDGKWFLRLEDTDRNRLQPEALTQLMKSMWGLGLIPDEGITLQSTGTNGQADKFYGVYQKGEFGPYIQSERNELYQNHAQILIERGLAYWNYLSQSEKEELQEIKQTTKHPINYFKICSEKFTPAELGKKVKDALNDERKPALMYKLQRDKILKYDDVLLGRTDFDLNLEEDFVILKSDGFPTYHLAHLVDDHLMQTTLIVRSQEWFPSVPKHVTMFKDYWDTEVDHDAGKSIVPEYVHLPVILGQTGNKKMSKRDGNVNMQDYLEQGFLPEAIINYLAFLGWNPGTEKELYLDKTDFE